MTRMNTVTNIVHLIFVVNCWGHHQPAIRKGRAYCGEGGGSGWQPSGGLGGEGGRKGDALHLWAGCWIAQGVAR